MNQRTKASSARGVVERTTGVAWTILVTTVALCALASRLVYLIRPFDSDGAMFIYMGRLISQGGRFGHDLVDNKLPTVGLMTSFCWRLFGAHWAPYVLSGAVMSTFAALVLWRAACRSFGWQAGRATLLFAIVYLNFNFAVFGGFQLETPQALLASIAAAAALDAISREDARDAFLVGLAAGTGALLKPTGIVVACAFAVAVVFAAKSWRSVIKLGIASLLGLCIPLATALAYLIAANNLGDLPAMARQISSYAANSSWVRADFVKPIVVLVLGGFPFLVRGYIFRRQHDRSASSPSRGACVFLLVWLTLECVGIAAQRRMYAYHFLVLAPPLALLFGALPRQARAMSLAGSLMPTAIFSLYGASLALQNPTERPTLAVSAYIRAHASAGDAAWKDDAARMLLETGLKSGSRYPLTFLFANTDTAPLEYSDEILKDFSRNRPRYIVLRADFENYLQQQCRYILELERIPKRRQNFQIAWHNIEQYVRENYEIEKTIGKEDIWRRREDVTSDPVANIQ